MIHIKLFSKFDFAKNIVGNFVMHSFMVGVTW